MIGGILDRVFNFFPDFYRLREYLFLYVVIFYLSQYKFGRSVTDRVSRLIMRGTWVVYPILIYLWRTQPPLNDFIGYWGWISPVEWVTFVIISYHYLNMKTQNPTTSLVLTGIATNAGGYIYEIPYFVLDYTKGYKPFIYAILKINQNNALLISSQIVCIFLLALLLHSETRFRPNAYMIAGASLVLLGYVFYRYINYYFVRIPTMLFIISLWSGVKAKPRCG